MAAREALAPHHVRGQAADVAAAAVLGAGESQGAQLSVISYGSPGPRLSGLLLAALLSAALFGLYFWGYWNGRVDGARACIEATHL
jgi:hypothetical protein